MAASGLTFAEKLLPDQPANANLFDGDQAALWQAMYRSIAQASGLASPMEELSLVVTDRFSQEEMGSNPVTLRFLQLLLRLTGARRVLEIGSFIGVSALYMAQALPEGGELVTIEKFDQFADLAEANFARNGLASRIRLLRGDAFEVLRQLDPAERFDAVFIDGNKERYCDYFKMLEPWVRPGGLMLVDDALFHGDVANPEPRTEKGRGVRAFLDFAATLTGWQRLLMPMANGLMILVKPQA
jgi:caffeoyl-CoA O-methyltransferase